MITITGVSSRKGLSSFTVSYNEAVTGSANSTALYNVFAGVKKVVKKHKQTVFTKPLPIKSVSPGNNPNTVTISLAKPFKGTVQVKVEGSITAQTGASNSIDSAINVT